MGGRRDKSSAFSLVEVVLAIGIVAFAVLSVFALLSVANDTNRRARDQAFSAQLAYNEFQRIRSLSSANFPTSTYDTGYYDSSLNDIGPTPTPPAVPVYAISMTIAPYPTPTPNPSPPITAVTYLFKAEVRYPAQAASPNQSVNRYSALIMPP